jgi:alpha-L-fucosidase
MPLLCQRRSLWQALAGLCFAASLFVPRAEAQDSYQPSASNLAARRAFQDAKFGMFIHWGVYSVLGDGEWVMQNRKLPISEYEKLPPKFDPEKFDAAAWVALAKSAGMKYITITSKHHDGFAMFDSQVSDWTIVKRTPWKKDPLRLLADECHKQGMPLFFYYSQLDWHSPDYFPRGQTGKSAGRAEAGDWDRYLDYQDAQLRELLTHYGEVGGIWFDGWWDKQSADWKLDRTYRLIHSLQPQAMVGNNRHRAPDPGEDFQMFEKDLPGQNKTGFGSEESVSALPLETAETMNGSWGYNASDSNYKSPRDLVQYLVRAAGNNANFLLNIGPRPDGTIQPEFVERLHQVGDWLAQNGDSIYGTRGGPIAPHPWGVTTQKGRSVYVHILDWPDPALLLPPLPASVKSAHALRSHAAVELKKTDDGLLLKLPPHSAADYDTIVVLELTDAASSPEPR